MTGEASSLEIKDNQNEKRTIEYAQKLLHLGVDMDTLKLFIELFKRLHRKN